MKDKILQIAAQLLSGVTGTHPNALADVKADAVKLAVDAAALLVQEVESRFAAPAEPPAPPPTTP